MATQILASGTGAATSGDVVVTTPLAVALKRTGANRVDENAFVEVQLQDDAGAYNVIGQLTTRIPGAVIGGAGTYRFVRAASSSACGVFSS